MTCAAFSLAKFFVRFLFFLCKTFSWLLSFLRNNELSPPFSLMTSICFLPLIAPIVPWYVVPFFLSEERFSFLSLLFFVSEFDFSYTFDSWAFCLLVRLAPFLSLFFCQHGPGVVPFFIWFSLASKCPLCGLSCCFWTLLAFPFISGPAGYYWTMFLLLSFSASPFFEWHGLLIAIWPHTEPAFFLPTPLPAVSVCSWTYTLSFRVLVLLPTSKLCPLRTFSLFLSTFSFLCATPRLVAF